MKQLKIMDKSIAKSELRDLVNEFQEGITFFNQTANIGLNDGYLNIHPFFLFLRQSHSKIAELLERVDFNTALRGNLERLNGYFMKQDPGIPYCTDLTNPKENNIYLGGEFTELPYLTIKDWNANKAGVPDEIKEQAKVFMKWKCNSLHGFSLKILVLANY